MAKQIDILCSEITLYNAWNIVKEKGAAGGIDGVTIMEFEKDKRKQISKLVDELANKTWKPYPYLEIEIAKDKSPEEKRKFGCCGLIARSIAIFDLLLQSLSQNHLRKMRILKKPDFEGFDENATKSHYLIFFANEEKYENACDICEK